MKKVDHKAVAYITHGINLLVFRHPHHPLAGIRVPTGTIEAGETRVEAVMREACEEIGLEYLQLHSFLGTVKDDISPYGRDEIQPRFFYHLIYTAEPPDSWWHYERIPSSGQMESILLEFHWASLNDRPPELIAGQGALLEQLDLHG